MTYFFLFQVESGDCLPDLRVSDRSILKRSHDQIENGETEKLEQSTQMETESAGISRLSSGPSALFKGTELQTNLSVSKSIASHPNILPAAAAGSGEESLAKKLPYIPVTGQQGMLPTVLFPSGSANQETRNATAVGPFFAVEQTSQPRGNVLWMYNDLIYNNII